MKKIIFPLALLCISFATFAQNNTDRDPRNAERALRECRSEADLLRSDNRLMSDRLRNQQCGSTHEDRKRIELLERENQDLRLQNSVLISQVEKLKIDNARLELELHPDLGGSFNLAQSVLACGNIKVAEYAQQCANEARANEILAPVIEQCAKVVNTYYALVCVQNAGKNNTNARQVEACLDIGVSEYVSQCVAAAGEKKISPDVIKSCVSTSPNTFLQLQCVKNM